MRGRLRFVDFSTLTRPARGLLLAIVAAAGTLTLPVLAQSGAAALGSAVETVSLPEVTVTARKRKESPQETPISVIVFSQDMLEKRTCATCATSGSASWA